MAREAEDGRTRIPALILGPTFVEAAGIGFTEGKEEPERMLEPSVK